MIPGNITRAHVLRALEEIKKGNIPPRRGSRAYAVLFQGDRYPPKLVISLANQYTNGSKLDPANFSGGHETNEFLRRLGFEVVETPSESRLDASATARKSPKPLAKAHGHTGERCPHCKETVLKLLQRLYGCVQERHALPLGTGVEAFLSTAHHADLGRIWEALGKYRGFKDFVGTHALPPCDYFVPSTGSIVEFDESQHFTEPRRKALENYPASLTLGFERERWKTLCNTIRARDPNPPFRDEQRAWYDTLRDFAPVALALQPTRRLYAKDRVWCTLDPDREADRALFRGLIEERSAHSSVTVTDAPSARIARIILTSEWGGQPERAREVLDAIVSKWPEGRRVEFLVTCGGFIQFPLLDAVTLEEVRTDRKAALARLLETAKAVARRALEGALWNRLSSVTRYVTLGIDSFKNKISTTQTLISEPHAEMVVLADLNTSHLYATAKSYPTPGQQRGLLRSSDLKSHFRTLEDGSKVMLLGCHDLTMFNPRGIANAEGWRTTTGSEFRSLARKMRPRVVLQHPHTTDSVRTWSPAWNQLMSQLSNVEVFASAGRYWRPGGCRSPIHSVLTATRRGPTLDFVVGFDVA